MSTVASSHFSAARETVIVIHGWQSNENTFLNPLTRDAYLLHWDMNIIIVDWSVGAGNINYITSRNAVNPTGAHVSLFLDNLFDAGFLSSSSIITCAGQSLGAHVCGATGKYVTRLRVDTIFGLDPAGPLFSLGDPANRLDAGDAEYVENLHTDTVLLGIEDAIGHVDHYANGGTDQPGCNTSTCDHALAANKFADSIRNGNFWGRRCTSQAQAQAGMCGGEGFDLMTHPSNRAINLRGIFWYPTHANSPFGVGQF